MFHRISIPDRLVCSLTAEELEGPRLEKPVTYSPTSMTLLNMVEQARPLLTGRLTPVLVVIK